MASNKKCLIDTCLRTDYARGLCMVCYGQAKKKVKAGETTWEKLVEMGLALPELDPFNTAYDKLAKDN